MRLLRIVLPALFACCLLFGGAIAFAGPATAATPIVASASPAPAQVLPPDPFLDGAVTTSVAQVCTRCPINFVDTCVGQPKGANCLTNPPNCHCRTCSHVFDCWSD